MNATHVGLRLLAMRIFQSIHSNQTDRYREQAKAYRGLHSRCQIEMQSKCGSELAREGALKFGANFFIKRRCLKDTFRHVLQATHPCAIAYSYARIRRLVRFGVGFYCGPVADESAIGFSDSDYLSASAFMASLRDSSPAITLWRLYAGDLRVYRGA